MVETTNFNDRTGAGGGFFSDAAKLTERFTRVAQDYVVYEYACHEGNYMMSSALEAARQLEKEGKDTRVDRGDGGGPPPRTPQ
ncbi:MAG TPA: hypothetical protein VE422_15900 [Terriglobia bacterium]|nr:hypothetical protein [Terriglobia bacterium]